jgi:hypothetical protein
LRTAFFLTIYVLREASMQNDSGPDFPEKTQDRRPSSIRLSEALLVFLFLGLIVILGLAVQHVFSAVPR